MGRYKEGAIDNPPKGLKEDYYDTEIPMSKLGLKYHIGMYRVYEYADRFQWKTKRKSPNALPSRNFYHGVKSGLIPDAVLQYVNEPFASFAKALLMSWPKHWQDKDPIRTHDAPYYDPTVHCFRPISSRGMPT